MNGMIGGCIIIWCAVERQSRGNNQIRTVETVCNHKFNDISRFIRNSILLYRPNLTLWGSITFCSGVLFDAILVASHLSCETYYTIYTRVEAPTAMFVKLSHPSYAIFFKIIPKPRVISMWSTSFGGLEPNVSILRHGKRIDFKK